MSCRLSLHFQSSRKMVRMGGLLFFLLFLQRPSLPESARILTLGAIGGSHYLLFDELSHVLQESGHEVTMLIQPSTMLIPDVTHVRTPPSRYKVISWSAGEESERKHREAFKEQQKNYLVGRYSLEAFMDFMGHVAIHCNTLLNQSDILNSLRSEKFEISVIDAFNPCSFLLAEKLGVPFVAFYSTTFANAQRIGIPSPLSYVPLLQSYLSDRMDFWGRVKNVFMFFASRIADHQIEGLFDKAIEENFEAGVRPTFSELYQKAELWIYNTDFSIEFARPLLPNTIYISGLLARPVKPLSQELEEFIATSGDTGFIIVTMGSMVSSVSQPELLKEMNEGFARVPQKVIWRFEHSKWPNNLKLAPNAKIFDWLSQNDLLGHPKARLLVTHGGMNSLLESIYHGVPVLGIPLFGDQFDNMVRAMAKNIGIAVPPLDLTAETFATTIKQIIEDPRYKSAAEAQSRIHRSQPFPPDQMFVRWIEHILQSKGGGHLRPYGSQQPWYQQYLLDVIAFLFASVAVVTYICVKLVKTLISKLLRHDKLKKN